MAEPDVDHIVAVHDLKRPLARAVASVLDGNVCSLRVTVVCHNVPRAGVADLLGTIADDSRVRLLDLQDGISSPSGPFNLGFTAASGRFTSIMGSDDTLESGAIDSWLAFARRTASDVVIPRVTVLGRGPMLTPPARPGRTRRLDGLRDRLAYRTSPLGLVSRNRFGQLRFPPGLGSGIDAEYGATLWFSGAHVGFDRRGPAYVVHEDGPTRVSTSRKPVAADASFLAGLLDSAMFASLRPQQRDSLVTKVLRGNLLMWITYRPRRQDWDTSDVQALGEALRALMSAAPRAVDPLSRTDRRILEEFASGEPDLGAVLEMLPGRTRLRPRNVLTRQLGAILARDAPIRFGLASKLLARGL